MADGRTSGTLVRKIRTFADDMRRAKGETSPAPAAPALTENPISQSAPALQPTQPPRQHIVPATADRHEDILTTKKAAGANAPEGTIIRETRAKEWSLGRAIGESLHQWAKEQNAKGSLLSNSPPARPAAARAGSDESANTKLRADRGDTPLPAIRTFARDIAEAQGKPMPGAVTSDSAAIKQARPTIRPKPQETASRARITEPTKILERDIAPLSERTLPEEVFAVPSADIRGAVVHGKRTPLPYGVADIAPVAPRAVGVPPQEVQHDAQQERQTTTETPQEQTEAPSRDIVFAPPSFADKKTEGWRTYRDDAIRDVQKNALSVPRIAAAEAARRAKQAKEGAPPKAPTAPSAGPFALAGLVMVVLIVGGGFGFFWYARRPAQEATTMHIATFFAVDAQTAAPFSENRAELLETLVNAARGAARGVAQIYPAEVENGGAVPASRFLQALEPRAPGSLIRSVDEEMVFGAYENAPFFVFKINQFDAAFAGMLDWEPFISADLAPLFGEPIPSAVFTDMTIDDTDVRILRETSGAERLVYGFKNKNMLIITASRAAFAEIAQRLR